MTLYAQRSAYAAALATGLAAVMLAVPPVMAAEPLGTAFMYQGRLKQGGQPFNGSANLVFKLYDADSFGNLLGTQTLNGVAVSGGLFTVQLNGAEEFAASTFNGDKRWLEVAVNGTALAPRQELTAAPYAVFSARPWQTSGTNVFYTAGGVGIGTGAPTAALDVRGGLTLDPGSSPWIFTGTGGSELNRYLALFNSSGLLSASGLKAGGVLVADNYFFANPGKNDLIVKGRVGVGTAAPNAATQLDVVTSGAGSVAVRGDSPAGNGVIGTSAAGGFGATAGVNSAANGIGVYGQAHNGTTGTGVWGNSSAGIGVYGATANAQTADSAGVIGRNTATNGNGVIGEANSGENAYGVWGRSTEGWGVYGFGGRGVVGETNVPNYWGVYAWGNIGASGTKSLHIDHPLDPENKYLLHYCAEGPEPLNLYRGNVNLDASGEAWVDLPNYFEEINREFSYVLTAVGAAMPNLHVASEVADNRFQIAGGVPGGKVSWEVKGMRNDLYVRHYGTEVERLKPAHERGRYQHPELYGQPPEMGIGYRGERGVAPLSAKLPGPEGAPVSTDKPASAPEPTGQQQ